MTRVLASLALGAVLLLGAPGRAQDATPARAFGTFWDRARGQPFPTQLRLWDQLVEAPRRRLYAEAVWEIRLHPDWRARRERMLRARFAAYPRLAGEVETEARALEATLPGQLARFRTLFPDAPGLPRIEVVLAPTFDAKSGLLPDGRPVLLLAADSLALERADLGILLPHELFHLYHAARAGIRNDGVMPGATVRLPLFAEGLATYVSSVLAPGRTASCCSRTTSAPCRRTACRRSAGASWPMRRPPRRIRPIRRPSGAGSTCRRAAGPTCPTGPATGSASSWCGSSGAPLPWRSWRPGPPPGRRRRH